ncbi:ATP-binding protein [Ligilactobacillus apodemi]|uniref:ATP-binding protein n=1 Tax=Ligilactobacillus apodemi TaxID=307126 RepID=UPI0022876C96|nr:ATP-binding protein [Ligilactobacillus apodemi]
MRPLLAFSKQQLADFAKEKDLFFFEDETNQSSAYFRNRIRHKIVPKLKQENPHFLSHVTEYSDQLAVLLQGCEEVAQEKLARLLTAKGYSIFKLQELSLAWQELTLRQLFVENSLVLEQKQLKQVMQLLQNNAKPQGSITLNQELILKKEYDVFRLETKPKEKTTSTKKIKLQVGQWHSLGNKTKIGIFVPAEFRLNMHDEVLLVSKDSLPLYLRKRHPGDRLLTSVGHQKVKKI